MDWLKRAYNYFGTAFREPENETEMPKKIEENERRKISISPILARIEILEIEIAELKRYSSFHILKMDALLDSITGKVADLEKDFEKLI